MEKTEWATSILTFLGIVLDGRNMILAIPMEKRNSAVEMLNQLLSKKKATVKDLQKLCGLLNFIGRVVFPGRTFTRRMYSKYSKVVNTGNNSNNNLPVNANYFKLKQHHHVRLDQEFKIDCRIWLEFLSGELQNVVCRPMVDVLGPVHSSKDIRLFSDTSVSEQWGGFGAVLNMKWERGDWDLDFLHNCSPNIEYLELFALSVGILTWEAEPELTNSQISVFCDNMAVVHMINSMVSSCQNCMVLLRLLTLNGLKFNRRLSA